MGYLKGKQLSQKQVALLWIAEGGSPAKADEASAVVMSESSGYTKAGNYCCHGLWAFNVEAGVASMSCALNPVCATRKAISLSKQGTDWTPWEGYTNGNYRQFLGKSGVGNGSKYNAKFASTQLTGLSDIFPDLGGPGPTLPDIIDDITGQAAKAPGEFGTFFSGFANTIEDIAGFFIGLGELILTPEGWLRIGKLIGGSILVLWGLRIVTKESTGTDPLAAAGKAVGAAATVATVK